MKKLNMMYSLCKKVSNTALSLFLKWVFTMGKLPNFKNIENSRIEIGEGLDFNTILSKAPKKIGVSTLFIFISLLLLNSNLLMGQTYAERTLYSETFSANEIAALELINKYGSIHVKNWDKDSIKITTDVYLSSTSRSKLEKLKDGVRIKYSKHNKMILAQTLLGDNQTSLLQELQYITRNFAKASEKRIEINYEVFIPKGVAVEIKNQYGDVFMGNFDSRLKIEQSNGSFKADNLNGEVNLKFSFVNAMANEIKDGVLELNYSNINLNKSVNFNCTSKSSEIYVDAIGVLKLKSSRDKINIGKLDYVYGSASYTNFKILQLNKEIDGYFTYGQISIDKMDKQVSLIDIDSERTDIKLFVPKSISYSYDILYNEDADILLPEKDIKVTNSMEMEEMKAMKGRVGSNPTLDIRIRALKRCLIQISHVSEN
ncbi:MAG: hypothetical protein PF517_16925 [Salinivirgaceae bacterium]|jgi:hypothetical protein|nr:hypothetical protein [Salinivirgaceae bacterium]